MLCTVLQCTVYAAWDGRKTEDESRGRMARQLLRLMNAKGKERVSREGEVGRAFHILSPSESLANLRYILHTLHSCIS